MTNTLNKIMHDGDEYLFPDTTYTAGSGINIDSNNEISNTLPGAIVSATAPSSPTEGMVWYDTTNDALKAYNGTSWETEGTKMVVLSYGHSTWQNFIDAYEKNAIVYCKASSQSNPGSGNQTRMAFMAFVDVNATTGVIQSVEFQYYRSRSSHSTAATVLDEVYIYKLTSNGTWTVTQRDTAAEPIAGTGIGLTYNASGMTIANTGVTSVNNQTGDVTIQEGIEYNAGEGIEIGTIQGYSAMQGPAPDGFHVPSVTEWQGLKTIMDGLSLTTGDGWRINLHMPFAGSRDFYDGALGGQGSNGLYWSSSPYFLDPNWGSLVAYFKSSYIDIGTNSYLSRAVGSSIRCFKDLYVTPDSSWTVIQGVLGSAGIFWNQSKGLISITDGSTGYTIMDKNLGATTVYSDGDTLTQANMGNMYQWGNNYGFPSTGTITNTSSIQVDASNYGPGNYYNSNTFITGSSDWSSVRNDNLWGITTGVVTLDNVITNTGVLSVNNQTGDVTIQEGIEYNAGDGIAIGERHKDTQGPCPDGFHVPTYGEMATLHERLSFHLGLDDLSPSLQEYLYLPSPGCLRGTDGVYVADEFGGTGQDFFYITATQSGANNAIYFLGETHSKTMAGAIRPFKDVPVVPDSSWTFTRDAEQYSGIAGTGVYYNPTLGLISLSKDMVNWITIPDKNLGATTVYDFGDTLSEANTGKFFQRGNNYGFPFTGAVTTSATQVDASGYGPGNYYSSDTFITGSNDWSSVENGNLWGGATDGIRIDENGNVIYNTGVLSVNNQTGAVTVSEFAPGGTATTGYVVTKTASGYGWAAPSGTTYNAGEGIEIKNGDDYSAMQGPAPDGFHVPSKDEWVALRGVLTTTFSMAKNATTMGTYLKMPAAGYRSPNDASVHSVGTLGYYWSSTSYDANGAYDLYFNSSDISAQVTAGRGRAFSVRCFKDMPAIPTSSWTTLYDGSSVATGAGVFYNATDGLISVSGDGQTWYTIMDKNLGATTVYNQGDTEADANCGYFYQRGNNYGFPHSGTITTTSSTTVDVTGYGPGNYYSSSIFITVSPRNSTTNDNLWGGVTGVVTFDNAITNTGVLVSDQPNNILTSGMKIWAGTETNYGNLGTYDSNTLYLTIE